MFLLPRIPNEALLPKCNNSARHSAKSNVSIWKVRFFLLYYPSLFFIPHTPDPAGPPDISSNCFRLSPFLRVARSCDKESRSPRCLRGDFSQGLRCLDRRRRRYRSRGTGATPNFLGTRSHVLNLHFCPIQSHSQLVDQQLLEPDLRARDRELTEIAKSIATLAELFKDLSSLVIDQGTLLDSVEYNIEQTAVNMSGAVKELEIATRFVPSRVRHRLKSDRFANSKSKYLRFTSPLPSRSHAKQVSEEYWQTEVHIPSFANYLWPRRCAHLQASAPFLDAHPNRAYNHSGSTRPLACAPLTNLVIGRIVMAMAIVLTGLVTSGTIQ